MPIGLSRDRRYMGLSVTTMIQTPAPTASVPPRTSSRSAPELEKRTSVAVSSARRPPLVHSRGAALEEEFKQDRCVHCGGVAPGCPCSLKRNSGLKSSARVINITPSELLSRMRVLSAAKAASAGGAASAKAGVERNGKKAEKDGDGFELPKRKDTAAQRLLLRCFKNDELTREEQKIVNEIANRKSKPKRDEPALVPVTDKNPYEILRDRPKQPKHAKSNLVKRVVSASARIGSESERSEPDSNVGSEVPRQWRVDVEMLERLKARRLVSRRGVSLATVVNERDLQAARALLHGPRESAVIAPGSEHVPLPRPEFGPVEDPQLNVKFPPLLEELEEPGDGIMGYRERRRVGVKRFTKYRFAYLDFIGWWNNSRFSSDCGSLFAEHLGFHYHEDYVEVAIPADLVNELKEWWNSRIRDKEGVNYMLSVQRCRVLTSELAISADQLRVATLYAPAIAFVESWDEQQNVARVAAGAYVRPAVSETFRKNRSALRTTQGKVVAVVSVLAVAGAVVGAAYAGRRVRSYCGEQGGYVRGVRSAACSVVSGVVGLGQRLVQPLFDDGVDYFVRVALSNVSKYSGTFVQQLFKDALYQPPAPRLVGIELNPGPVGRWPSRASRRTAGMTLRDPRPVQCRMLVNCVELPAPRKLKPKAKLALSGQELRSPLNLKTPLTAKGVHATYGFDTKLYAPTGMASNQHNEKQALTARVLCDTDVPTDDLAACLQWCKRNHRELFPYMHRVKSVSFAEYLSRSNASPSVKRVLQQTMNKLQADGICEESTLTKSQLYRYTYRSSFVKVENDLYTSPAGRKNKAPRLIQGAQPEFICLVGPWIMALQDLLKRRWDKTNNICFTSGVSADEAAKHICDGYGPWLEDDLGKFDSSIRRDWCEYEVWLCRKFGAPRVVLELMTANIATHGSTLHGWKYKCDGTRKSGDPYTSLMNSIINGLAHAYLYCKWTGKSAEQMRLSLRMLVQGDDNCMRHAEEIIFPWKEGMSGLGFDSEAIYRRHYFEVEFCSCRLYAVQGGVTFGPKPGRVLAKMGYVINPPVNVSRESMMRGIAIGLIRATSYIPPLNSTVNRILELTAGHSAWFDRKLVRHVSFMSEAIGDPLKMRKLHVTIPETMLNLNYQYDWDYGKQGMYDRMISTMQLGDTMDGLCELFLDRDTSGPQCIYGGWAAQLYCAAAA